jgi:RHS repeat-associated protein
MATATPLAFRYTGILDNFNRANNDDIGSNWSGSTSSYRIKTNRLDVLSDGDIYWSASPFGISQEVYVKLYTIDSSASRIGVLLKSQSSSGWGSGVLEVFYHPGSSTVQVWTYESSQGWVQHGTSLSVSFANGNILGVRAYASGTVEVYKNGSLIGTRDVSSWPFYDDSGYIGLRTVGGPSTYYDDFGGGSLPVAYQPGNGKVLAAYLPPPPGVRLKARPHLARAHPSIMLLTRPAGVIWRSYYYAGPTRIAMREDSDQGSEVYYILTDHLGSTSVAFTFDEYDQVDHVSRQWYTPWGESRPGSSVTATDYGFTGQLEDSYIGLYWYRSRWFDPVLSRFAQADTVVPLVTQGVQAWNRFAYVNNNPLKYKDPNGHEYCDDLGNCYNKRGWYRDPYASRLSTIDTWKMMILDKFHITMSDDGDKPWSTISLQSVFVSLQNVNNALNNRLKYLVGGAKFWLKNQDTSNGQYHGSTHLDGSGIDFYTVGDAALRQINVYHEVGHLLDNVPDLKDKFTNAVSAQTNPSWISNNRINADALKSLTINDPNYDSPSPQARQTYSGYGPSEQWADAFGNYVAANIDLSDPDGPGVAMYNFVRTTLAPYIGVP